MAVEQFHWRDIPIAMWLVWIGFAVFAGHWFYKTHYYFDLPAEVREYCEGIGMIAHRAGNARDLEGMSDRQYSSELRTLVGGNLLDDWKLVIEGSFNQMSKNPEEWGEKMRSDCLWRFRHGGKTLGRDHGRVFW